MPIFSMVLFAFFYTIRATLSSSPSFVDLHFDLKLKHVPQECRTLQLTDSDAKCQLSYAISVLQSFGDFELNAIMLQEGHVNQVDVEKKHFREDTVVAIPTSVRREEEGSVYVGIRIYGLPKHVQDYFVIDVTKLFRHPTSKSVTSVDADDLSFVAVAKYGKTTHLHRNENENCICNSQSRTCKCCAKLNFPKIGIINQTGCINISYLSNNENGLFLQFYHNQQLVYNRTTTIENTKPLCFQTTFLKEYANLCLRLQDVDIKELSLGGCLKLDSELYHVRVSIKDMGCFRFQPRILT